MHRSLNKLSNTISASLVISRKFAIVTEILSSIQLMHIILLTTLPAEQTNLEFLKQITALPTLDSFVIADLTILIIIVSLVYFLVRILLTIRISIQISRGGNELETNISKTLAMFCIVHSRVFFFIFMNSYFAVISNYTPIWSDHSDIYHPCGTGWFVLAVILSVLNASFAFTQEFFLYRINKNQNAYAAKNNHMHKIVLFQKFFSLISYFFFQETALKTQITSVLHLLIIIFALCIFYTTLPFYNMQLLKIILVMTAINFSLSAVSIVYAFDNEIGPGLLMSCIIMIIFHWLYFKKILQRILDGGMETPQKAIHFAILMKENNLGSPNLSLFKKKFKTISLFASGYMQREGLDPFKVKEAQSAKEYETQAYEHIIKRLTFVLNRNPTSASLALYIANLYLKKMKNIFMASNFLRQLADRELGIAVKNSLQNMYIQLKNACDRIYAGNRTNLELKSYLEYKERTEIMKKDIDLETSKHIQFWQELGNKKLSIIKLYNLASEIDKLEYRIISKYNSLKEPSSAKYIPSLLVYTTYLQIIKEVPYEATKIFKTLQAFAITRTASQAFDVYADNSCVITFSINKGQLGTIIDASASTQNLFYISKSKLLGGTLHRLLPKAIADKYTLLLGDSIKNPLYSPASFTTYAKIKNGEYFEIHIQPQIHFHSTHGLSLIIIFTKTSNLRSVIIVDEWNRIQEYSADLKEILNLEDNKQTPYRLNDILPGYNAASSLLNSLVKTKSIEGSPRTSSPNGSPSRSLNGRKFSIFRSPTDHSKQNIEDSILFSASHARSRNNEDAPFIGSARRSSRIHFQTLMLPELSDGLFLENRKRFKEDLPTEDEQLNLSRHDKMNFCPFGQRDIILEYNTEIKAIKLDDKIFKIIILTAVGNNNDLRLEERNSPRYKRKQEQKLNDSFPEIFPEDEERPNLIRLKLEEKHHTDKDKSRQRPAGETPSFESSSFLTKNLSKKLQIALCKNKEKRPSVALLQTLEQTEDRSSSCVSQNRVIMTIKTLKQIFSRGYTSNFSRFLVFFFYCVMALLLLFAGLNFSWAKNSFYQVKNGLQIVNIANQRLTTAVDAWAKLLMILSRATDTIPNPAVAGIFQGLVYADTLDLITKNFELHEYLQSTLEADLLNKMFDKNVHFWESSNNTTTGIFEGNSFLATDFLVNKYLNLANSSQILATALTSDYISVLNNTANDYLLSSEQTAIITQDLLNTIIYKNENSLDWILGLTCSSLALLLCILFVLVWTIAQSYNRLVLTLVKIPHQQITQRIEQLTNVKQSLSQDVHTKEFANQQIQLLSKNMEPAKNANFKHVSESYYNESHWSRQILSYLIRYIGLAVLCILLICGLSIKSVITTRKEFNIMESVQEQLSVTTDAMYQANMLFGNFYFLVMLKNQSNVFIRNMLPDDQIAYTLDTVQQLNSRLLNAFSDKKKSNIDPIIENVLQNNLCDYVLMSDRTPGFCEGATKGSSTGLLSLITNYYTYSSQYIELYQKNRTLSYAKGLLKPYATSTSVDLAVIYESFIFIISHVLDDLDINVEAFVKQETIQLLIMTIVIVVSTGLIRGIVKKRIQNFDLGRRRILKNLSFYTIQGNKFFRYYLVKEFQKEIASIKDIL